ncbi:MAG TPA: riboflavin synthase [Candidatus Dormibacteraeota bacterium]|nr:riboflavin synthase [Candidatus Dormibacteraeota bacterium]
MFTGLIEHGGRVRAATAAQGGVRLAIVCPTLRADGIAVKDSIAVNGVCLTAVEVDEAGFAAEIVPETLARSNLGALVPGDSVNVEGSLRLGDRVGGHFVYGHVDACVEILAKEREGQGWRLRVERPGPLAAMLAEKAFVALDGVSVTIAAVGAGWLEVALIPETARRTTLGEKSVGDRVNVEVDPVARYAAAAVAALMERRV